MGVFQFHVYFFWTSRQRITHWTNAYQPRFMWLLSIVSWEEKNGDIWQIAWEKWGMPLGKWLVEISIFQGNK
jgi:hypothetical protein